MITSFLIPDRPQEPKRMGMAREGAISAGLTVLVLVVLSLLNLHYHW